MEKKQQYIVIGVVAVVAIAGIGGGFGVFAAMQRANTLIYGNMYGPVDLDPIQAWDDASGDAITQVVEGLFDYDYDDPDLGFANVLATSGVWNEDGDEFTCALREGVSFHDGADFNAEAVKWNFDRLYGMIDEIQTAELYILPSEEYIIKETVVVDDYTVKFVLNAPYVPFQGLLCFYSSGILSPDSTPIDTLIDTATGDLIGTGPFIYDGYEADVEVSFSTNPNYWGGAPLINDLVYSIITDSDARHSALLTGDIDLLKSPLPEFYNLFESDPGIELRDVGQNLGIQYLFMNNKQIPKHMRKAISYALDYDYIIAEIMDGEAVRMKSPIPLGIKYANWEDFDLPVLDLAVARQVLINSGAYGSLPAVNDDDAWEDLAETNPIATYNYTYNIGNQVREDILILLTYNLGKIGVAVEDCGMTWQDFIYRGYEVGGLTRDMVQLGFIGWGPDYNDPSNFINPLFTNKAIASNFAQVDDNLLQQWMEEALTITDETEREAMYYKIQERLIEEIYPWCYCYVGKNYDAFSANLKGLKSNAMDNMRFKHIYFETQ